jgi:transposase
MPKACSSDLRERVIKAVGDGASRREAAERFEVSVSSAVKWDQAWRNEGRHAAKPRGGSASPLDEHAKQILRIVGERPDATLAELSAGISKSGIACSRSALWRFFDRRGITHKKSSARRRAEAGGRRAGTPSLEARAKAV